MPATAGYMAVAGGLAIAIFWVIWWLLRSDGEEAPWLPAGLTAGFVILAAAAAREVVMRRAWARYTREMDLVMGASDPPRSAAKAKTASSNYSGMQAQVAALRGLQQRLSELAWPFTPIHSSSPMFSTMVGSALHGVLPPLQPGHG